MRRSTKMMFMASRPEGERSRRDGREIRERPMNYPGMDGGYADGYPLPEDRFRDRRGREHYDDGRYAPKRTERSRNEGYGEIYDSRYYPYYPGPYYPPIRGDGDKGGGQMNKIGFSVEGEMERIPDEYRNREYPIERHDDETMSHYERSRIDGRAMAEADRPVTIEEAEHWVKAMENADETHGPHWPIEQTKQVQAQHGINCDPIEFYVAMNMMYSDYVNVAKKLGISKVEFYAYMAKAFLDDKDAGPGKLRKYFEDVVNA